MARQTTRHDTATGVPRPGALSGGELMRRDAERGARRILDATADLNETETDHNQKEN